MIELTINDKKVSVEANTTILDAARSAGIHIPTLCAHKGLTPIGACRVCVVEVEGERKPVASCHVPAMNGMVVKTDTPRLWELRKMMVELILATHPLECPVCDKGGECELQDITHAFGIKEPKYKLDNPKRTRIGANPFLYIDFQRCIQCIRCARYTEEVEGVKAFDYHGSGGYSFEMDRHLEKDPEAESIAGVISICPVGSMLNHPMKLHSIRPWELTKTETTCPHCSDGCRLVLNTAHDEIYRITALSETDFSHGHPCLRGRFGYGFVHDPSRIKVPMVKVEGVQRETNWDDALGVAALRLKEIKEKFGPGSVWGLPSPRLTNEEHIAFSSLFSAIGGKVALSDGVGNTALSGVKEVLGEGYLRPLNLIDESDLIVVIGADLTETNPFLANRVSRTARLKESKAIVINPRKIELSKSAWRWAAPRPGTEAALVTWIGKLVGAGLKSALTADWMKDIDENHLAAMTGVDAKLVNEVSKAIIQAERPCIIVGDDFSYSDNRNVGIAAANLLILSGRSASDGAGVFPVLNESNSWGAVTIHKGAMDMNALHEGIKDGKVKALYLSGEDPIGDWPSGWEDALRSLELLIVQDSNKTKTTEAAHIVLPSLTFAEANGAFSDHAGVSRELKETLRPFGVARPGKDIISELAGKMGAAVEFRHVPAPSQHGGASAKPVQVSISSPLEPNKDNPFLLLTGKKLYGSYSLFEKCRPLFDAAPDAVLEINPKDADRVGIRDGFKVKISSETGSVEAKVSVKDTVLPGNVYLPIHPLNGSQRLRVPHNRPCFVKVEAI